jgi:hypothetical protein
MPCDPLSVFLLWFEASFSRNLLVLFKGNSLSTHKKSLSSLLTPPNFKVPYQPMFLFIVPYLPLSHFPSNVVSIIWSRCINLDKFTPSLYLHLCFHRQPRLARERERCMGAGSRGNGGLCGSGSASVGTGVLRGRRLREDRARAGGSCGRRSVRPCSARGTPRQSSPPWHACTTRRRPRCHCRAAPPSLHRSRETFPPSPRVLHLRGAAPGHGHLSARPCVRSRTDRSKRHPHPPPPRNHTLMSP